MNRVALLLLIVATLAGCGGGTKSAPNTPDPVPDVPTPSADIPDRHPHQVDGQGAGPSAIANEPSTGEPLSEPVDWVEFLSPPFEHDEIEFFRVHLASPADELTWRTSSLDNVEDVHSDRGGTDYITDDADPQNPLYLTWSTNAGPVLRCAPGYEEVTIECWIKRSGSWAIMTSSWVPRHAPPAAGPMHHFGIVGASGQERSWDGGASINDEFQWDFGGGVTPNSEQGSQRVTTTLGAPGRYTANYTVRNEWGFSGPQEIGYWIQPAFTKYALGLDLDGPVSVSVVDDRIRMLVPDYFDGYRYAEALTPMPESLSDWRFSDLPMPESHSDFMQLGMHAGHLLVVGGQANIDGEMVIVYYRAAVPSPQSAADWDVGGIPESAGVEVFDFEIEADRVGLLARQNDNLVLLWDDTPVLSQWQFSEVAQEPYSGGFHLSRLILPETGPVVIGFTRSPDEPTGLKYRSATWDAPDAWSVHSILDVVPWAQSDPNFLACIYHDRPLVLANLTKFSAALLWSNAPRPLNADDWERLETSDEIAVPSGRQSSNSIQVSGDRIALAPVSIKGLLPEGTSTWGKGGLLLQGDPSDLTHWTPYWAPSWEYGGSIVATMLIDDGVGRLTSGGGGLHFGMLTP